MSSPNPALGSVQGVTVGFELGVATLIITHADGTQQVSQSLPPETTSSITFSPLDLTIQTPPQAEE